jgi:hypothetical protein
VGGLVVLTRIEIAPIKPYNSWSRRTVANRAKRRRAVPKGIGAYRIARRFWGLS